VTAYVSLSVVAVGVLVCIQAPVFLLFQAMGWLPSRHPHVAGENERSPLSQLRETDDRSDGEAASN
jgi:hypothetical protein